MTAVITSRTATADFDVLIVGAGISGIGAACHLKTRLPEKTFTILESRDAIGGTWSLFRYPGIRSDSDMPSFSFAFKPWTHKKAIAGADAILDYLRETVTEKGIDQHIRFRHRVLAAEYSSMTGLWTVTAQQSGADQTRQFSARFLFFGTGYYDYAAGYTPQFPGMDDFTGTVIHPQQWPEGFDYRGKQVVVIGSGATAVTLIPAMSGTAGHVTMLQRSPSYLLSLPGEDAMANTLHKVVGARRAHSIVRRKNIAVQRIVFKASRRYPMLMRHLLIAGVRRQLPKHFDVATHFTPRYNPWDQRLCLVPDGDLFRALSSGKASVVTDQIDRFTETGIRLQSGRVLDADLVVTATGLELLPFGKIRLSVDGAPMNPADTTAFKAMMLSGVPNFVFAFGYTNIAWTLKVDLVCEHFCRLLSYMDEHGYRVVQPVLDDVEMQRVPLFDLTAGYVQRGIARFPKAGASGPWTTAMAYEFDVQRLRSGPVSDPALSFSSSDPADARTDA